MVLALFRTESDQRINCPIRTNTQRFCLARAVHYQPAPHHPGTRQEPYRIIEGSVAAHWCFHHVYHLFTPKARRYGVLPLIRARDNEHGSDLGTIRRVVENAIFWLLM